MKYNHFNTEDFITDEYFQKWILDSDEMVCDFWENWLIANPDKRVATEKAAEFIRLMDAETQLEGLSPREFNAMWRAIIENRDNGIVNMRDVPGRTFWSMGKKAMALVAVFIGAIVIFGGAHFLGLFETVAVPISSDSQIILKLEDGTQKVLNENTSLAIKNSKGKEVGVQRNNLLRYDGSRTSDKKAIAYNTLSVPYGKKFELMLSDSTHVFLNSGSQLRYPVNFLDKDARTVFLDGEAYFAVKEDKVRPFTVVTDHMNTKVYGTEFNVSSYNDENNTFVVLVEGSVGLYKSDNDEGQKPIMIVPGQRGVLEDNVISIDEVNIDKYVAWTKGELYFMNDTFDLIIKELERHYNVGIDNKYGALNKKRFTGTFTTESLDQVLRVCSEHTSFRYRYDLTSNTMVIEEK